MVPREGFCSFAIVPILISFLFFSASLINTSSPNSRSLCGIRNGQVSISWEQRAKLHVSLPSEIQDYQPVEATELGLRTYHLFLAFSFQSWLICLFDVAISLAFLLNAVNILPWFLQGRSTWSLLLYFDFPRSQLFRQHWINHLCWKQMEN